MHRALVIYSVKLSCWTQDLDPKIRIRIQIMCPVLSVSAVTQNCKVLVLQRILEIANGVMEFFP